MIWIITIDSIGAEASSSSSFQVCSLLHWFDESIVVFRYNWLSGLGLFQTSSILPLPVDDDFARALWCLIKGLILQNSSESRMEADRRETTFSLRD